MRSSELKLGITHTSHIEISRHVSGKLNKSLDPVELLFFCLPVEFDGVGNRYRWRRESPELVGRDYSEVRTSASEGPEEVEVLRLRTVDVCSVCKNDVGADHPVESEAFVMRNPSITSMENMARDSDGRAAAVRNGTSALSEEAGSNITQSRACSHGGDVGSRIDNDAVHIGQIHDQMIVFTSKSQGSIAVSATTGTDLQARCDTASNNILDMLDCVGIDKKGGSVWKTDVGGGSAVGPVCALRTEEGH